MVTPMGVLDYTFSGRVTRHPRGGPGRASHGRPTMEEVLDREVSQRRTQTLLLSVFAGWLCC